MNAEEFVNEMDISLKYTLPSSVMTRVAQVKKKQ